MKITIERLSTKEKMELTVSEHMDVFGWETMFRNILRWVSFTEQTINEIFGSEE